MPRKKGTEPVGRLAFAKKVAQECFDANLAEEHVYLYAAAHVDRYCEDMVRLGKWKVLKARGMKDQMWDCVLDMWMMIKNDGKRLRAPYVSQGKSERYVNGRGHRKGSGGEEKEEAA